MFEMQSMSKLSLGAAAPLVAIAAGAFAEPLDPPDGPVDSTGAEQIFELPYTIDEPGAYRLAQDLTAETQDIGITINADHVTLNLGGHALLGDQTGADAIMLLGNRTDVVIRNGHISGWNAAAVWDESSADDGLVVEDLTIGGIGLGGIEANNSRTIVRRVVVAETANAGVGVGADSHVVETSVRGAGTDGIVAGDGSIIKDCTVDSAGALGISAGAQCMIKDTVVRGSVMSGVMTGPGAVVRSCVASGNGNASAGADPASVTSKDPRTGDPIGAGAHAWGVSPDANGNEHIGMPDATSARGMEVGPDGFALGFDSMALDCQANGNAGDGLSAGSGASIKGGVFSQNGESGIALGDDASAAGAAARNNGEDGVETGARCIVRSCTAMSNSSGGVAVDVDSHIASCIVSLNDFSGIVVFDRTTVRDCTSINNADGLLVFGDTNRIDGNTIVSNDSGIVLQGAPNTVVRNDLTANTIEDSSLLGNDLPPEDDFDNPWTNFD